MRKVTLAAGTMLAGLAAATPAMAEMEMTFSGSLDYQMVWNTNDQPVPGTGFNISAVDDQSELIWAAQNTSDIGLTYGAIVEWGYTGNGSGAGNFDESFLYFSDGWGRVHVGAFTDPVDDMATGGHDVQAHSEGFDGEFGDYYTQIGDAGFLGTEASTDDANKIAYYTPNFAGFEVGIAFSPDTGSEGQSAGTNNSGAYNVIETAAAWGGSFGDVDLAASLGYRHGGADTNTSGTDAKDINAWRLGAKIGFGPVEFGAGYGDNGDSACTKGTACDAGTNFQLGFGWDYGMGRFAIGYATGEETNNNGTEDSVDVYNISIDAGIAEGLVAYGDLVHARSDNGVAGAANENEGTVLLVGTAVFF